MCTFLHNHFVLTPRLALATKSQQQPLTALSNEMARVSDPVDEVTDGSDVEEQPSKAKSKGKAADESTDAEGDGEGDGEEEEEFEIEAILDAKRGYFGGVCTRSLTFLHRRSVAS